MEQGLIYIGILIIASLTLLLVGLLISYLNLVGKYTKLKEDKYQNLGFAKLFDKVTEELDKLFNAAKIKLEEITKTSEGFSKDSLKIVRENIDNSMQSYINDYKNVLKNVEEETIKIISNIPNYIKETLNQELSVIRQKSELEVSQSLQEAKRIVLDAYKKVEDEVNRYRDQRLKQVDESIIAVLQEIARKVLSREINREEHEKLVVKALEEAKRHHFFSSVEEGEEVEEESQS